MVKTTDTQALNIRVAELLGWTKGYDYHEDGENLGPMWDDGEYCRGVAGIGFDFFGCAATDYEVLCHVRETWEQAKRERFVWLLIHVVWHSRPDDRGYPPGLRYRPGDYARAALSVKEEK